METSGQMTDPSGAVVFDTSSGISLDEQREILENINAMSAGNRLAPETDFIKAKKRGIFFPIVVNISAVILLGLGFALLSLSHGQDEQSIRDSSAALGLTERKLILEIREETTRQIDEKENEINGIRAKLSAAAAEYRQLQISVESLTEEQQERAAALLSMQEEYRGTLFSLEEEKAKIIEDSRRQETVLRAQAEEKVNELSSQVEQSRADLTAAAEELGLLSREQERAALAESQMAGYYTLVNDRLGAKQLDEASAALETMKEFLDAPSFQGIRSMEARKQTHLTSIAALEKAVAEARRFKEQAEASGGTAQADKIDALEKKISDQEKTIAVFKTEGSELGEIVAGYEERIKTLEDENSKQRETIVEQDTSIKTLENDSAAKSEDINSAGQIIAQQESAISTQNDLLNSIPQVVEDAIEVPEIQDLLGPGARQGIVSTIQAAIQRAIQQAPSE